MKVKVDVPATNGRKAYSYMREGGEGSAKSKSSGISKKAAAGLGAIALGGLAAGGLTIAANSKKKRQQAYKAKANKALEDIEAKDKEISEAHTKNMKDLDESSRQTEGIGKDSPFAGLSEDEIKEARKGISEARKRLRDLKNNRENPKSKASEPFIDVKSEVVREAENESFGAKVDKEFELISRNLERNGYRDESKNSSRSKRNRPALDISIDSSAIASSESPKSIGSAIAPSTVVTSESSGKLADVIRKSKSFVKEGWERDRQAKGISSLKDNEYDVNQLANKAGQGTRSALESVSNFANSFMQSFVGDKNTVETKSSEVKTKQKAIPSRIRRPNKTITKSIRRNSLGCRIDSFIQSLRSKSCSTT